MEQRTGGSMFKGLIKKFKLIKISLKHPGKGDSSTYMKFPKDYDFRGGRVLNLGCGTTTYTAPNVVNLDMFEGDGINCVCDLGKEKLPFKDGEFDFIIANMILEHVPNWFECFKECARVLKVGGIIEIWLPGDGGSSQLGYRDHINVINYCSFYGIRGTHRNNANSWEEEEKKHLGSVIDLKQYSPIELRTINEWWIYIWPVKIQLWMMDHLRNIIQEEGYRFIKLPPEEKNGKL